MTPLNRTLRALELLKISRNDNLGGAFLNTAYGSTRIYIDRLRTQCAWDAANSAGGNHEGGEWAWAGGDAGSGVVYLFLTIFSDHVVGLAGSLVHEGRHKIKRHNGGANCPRKASCDSSWSFGGANQWEANYLWWYGTQGTNSQRFMRQFALDRARLLHERAFVTHPGLNIPKLAR